MARPWPLLVHGHYVGL